MSQPSLHVRPIEDGDIPAVITLWERAGLTRPHNDPHQDIHFARQSTNADVLVGLAEDAIVASVMVGHDGHRGAVYYVAVDPTREGAGYGRSIMAEAETWLLERGVWKLNLVVRASNEKVHGFYETLGYEHEPRSNFAKRLV